MSPAVLTVVATAVAVALLVSTMLFVLEVFFRRRDIPGQVLGLVLSLFGDVAFVIVSADRLPGQPMAVRNLVGFLPGSTTAFASSVAGLAVLVVVYVLRALIYYRLFIVPAMKLSDAEYNSPHQLEERANDYTAPVLAFTALAVSLASGVAGTYALP